MIQPDQHNPHQTPLGTTECWQTLSVSRLEIADWNTSLNPHPIPWSTQHPPAKHHHQTHNRRMSQPAASCPCTPVGKEFFDLETNRLKVSVTFDPGCSVCAVCTCTPAQMDLLEGDKWAAYVSQNESCSFCYPDPPDLLLFQPHRDQDEPCAVCGAIDDVCDCFADNAAGIEQGRRMRLRRLGRRLVDRLRTLRRDSPGGSIMRALSWKLIAARRGRSFREQEWRR